MNKKNYGRSALRYILVIIVALFAIFPTYWMVTMAFKPQARVDQRRWRHLLVAPKPDAREFPEIAFDEQLLNSSQPHPVMPGLRSEVVPLSR